MPSSRSLSARELSTSLAAVLGRHGTARKASWPVLVDDATPSLRRPRLVAGISPGNGFPTVARSTLAYSRADLDEALRTCRRDAPVVLELRSVLERYAWANLADAGAELQYEACVDREPHPPSDIAVVIATRNRARLLTVALDSVRDQEGPTYEVVVVDDGSTDATAEVMAAYCRMDQRIRYVRVPNHGSGALPRNLGAVVSTADYLAFLDDDSAWRDGHLAALWQDRADLTYTNLTRMTSTGALLDVYEPELHSGAPAVDTSGILVRSTAFPGFRERRGEGLSDDWALAYDIVQKGGKVVHVPVATVEYFVNPQSFYYNYQITSDGLRSIPRDGPRSALRAWAWRVRDRLRR